MIIQETPTLNLQFDKAKNDSDMLSLLKSQGGTFTRGAEVVGSGDSVASYFDALGILRYAKLGHPRPNFEDSVNQGLLIEEARTNLLKHSENFSNAVWSKSNGGTGVLPIVTPNDGIAPNGELSADRIDFDRGAGNTTSAISSISQFFSVTPQNYAGYVYFKAATSSDVGKQLSFRQVGVSGYTSITLSSEWQRLGSVELSTITGTRSIEITCRGGVGVTGSNQVSAHIWGAQLEAGSFETTYIPTKSTFVSRASTATYFDQNGVLQTADVNEARDNNHGYINDKWVKTGLLIEEQRTNLITYSEDFSDVSWQKLNVNTTGTPPYINVTNAPNGELTAYKIIEDTTSNIHVFVKPSAIPSGTHTLSIFAKKSGRDLVALGNASTGDLAFFDLTNGTVIGTGTGVISNARITSIANGWFRISCVNTRATASSYLVAIANTSSSITYTGDGTSGIFIWGAQLEAGSFPTSYIPTAGTIVTRSADITTSASVTRGAEIPKLEGSSFSNFFNNEEGSFIVDFKTGDNVGVGFPRVFHITDGTQTNQALLFYNGTRIRILIGNGFVEFATPLTNNTRYKVACKYTKSEVKLLIDGFLIGTGVISSFPVGLDRISIGNRSTGVGQINSPISKLIYYPKALPDADLQLLTRI